MGAGIVLSRRQQELHDARNRDKLIKRMGKSQWLHTQGEYDRANAEAGRPRFLPVNP